jgi:pyridoxal phosphate phosphatase PHOSPHO2
MQKLAIFDFDSTLISCDSSDTLSSYQLPNEIESLYNEFNWPTRMNACFKYLKQHFDINSNDIVAKLGSIQIEKEMKHLIMSLKKENYKLLIISDSNKLFIETILNQNNMISYFDEIITNQATINQDHIIEIRPYLDQMNKLVACEYCAKLCARPSICKKAILQDYISNNDLFTKIVFVGDGDNDFCVSLILNEDSFLFAKQNLALYNILETNKNNKIRSKVFYWNNANDIYNYLFN